jgi:SAM-dependent methyltransferase
MTDPASLHADQVDYWNGPGGTHWAAEAARTDRVLAPVTAVALDRAGAMPGEIVLDIGCGAGTTSAELARRVGDAGRVIGLDVSAPLVAAASARFGGLGNLEFRRDDAATAAPGAPGADLAFSKFGVMFFGDPEAAFANLRRALKPGGRLCFACWRSPGDNPWMMVPLIAAYAHVPRLPEPGPADPGPFSFADPERVRRILGTAGFADPALEPVDLALDLGCGGGLDGAVEFACRIGAASRALQDQPAPARTLAIGAIRSALEPFVQESAVMLPAAIWIVTARA